MNKFKKGDPIVVVRSAHKISSTKDLSGTVVRTIGYKVLVDLDDEHTHKVLWYNSSSLDKKKKSLEP